MRVFIRPKEGGLVRDPRTRQPVPSEGKEVTLNSFWSRRLSAGDVELGNRKSAKKRKKSEEKPDQKWIPAAE